MAGDVTELGWKVLMDEQDPHRSTIAPFRNRFPHTAVAEWIIAGSVAALPGISRKALDQNKSTVHSPVKGRSRSNRI
jgi:hypothetical protein